MKTFKLKTRLGLAFLLAGILSMAIGGARAQSVTPGLPLVPLGYCQLTSVDTAAKLSSCSGGIPSGATLAFLVPEAQAIRYRDDTVAPTAAVGFPVAVAAMVLYGGTLSNLQVISQVSGAKLNVLFYRSP